MYRTDFGTLWEKVRVGCFERITLKQVYYQGWNRSPAQVGCMRQVLGPGALWRPRGIGWRGRWEGGSGWGIHVNPWLIHVNVWQKPLQYCKVISLQLIKINEKKIQVTLCKIFCVIGLSSYGVEMCIYTQVYVYRVVYTHLHVCWFWKLWFGSVEMASEKHLWCLLEGGDCCIKRLASNIYTESYKALEQVLLMSFLSARILRQWP